jgi:hypothetical protein
MKHSRRHHHFHDYHEMLAGVSCLHRKEQKSNATAATKEDDRGDA